MATLGSQLARFVESRLLALADPAKAAPMAAYMKTTMPFYGVQKPARMLICRELRERFSPTTQREYETLTLSLWQRPHREEKYLAIGFAQQHPAFITLRSIKLYERFIRDGAWWDFVDEVALRLVGRLRLNERDRLRPLLARWIDDRDMWIRRTALISQIGHRKQTDESELFEHCLRRADEREFFIRKAIGWALRDYSYVAPQAVKKFLLANRDRLSVLSFREGAKQLVRSGAMKA